MPSSMERRDCPIVAIVEQVLDKSLTDDERRERDVPQRLDIKSRTHSRLSTHSRPLREAWPDKLTRDIDNKARWCHESIEQSIAESTAENNGACHVIS